MESKELTTSSAPLGAAIEQVLVSGNLANLTPDQRVSYYNKTCESLGLNPLTRPFEYITLNGKLTLYARKDCTEQLRSLRNLSIGIASREVVEGVYVVTAKASNQAGRSDESIGAVPIDKLTGEARANAMMKAECVPLDTEILTRRGFVRYDKLHLGEAVLAYDCARDATEWVPLEDVTVYKAAQVSVLHGDKNQFQVTCTPNHSWAVQKAPYRPDHRGNGQRGPRGPYAKRKADRQLIEAQEIRTHHAVILAAPCIDEPSLLTPIEAAILGWVVTDGTIKRVGNCVRLGICQSKEEHKGAIRKLVSSMTGAVKESISPGRNRTFPMTGRTYACKPQHWWYLSASVSRALLEKAGFHSRADLPGIATSLGAEARGEMLGAMMAAEGDARGTFANTDPHIMETFQILSALQGLATGALHTIKGPCFTQRLKKTRHVAGSFLHLTPTGERAVWCPTTRHGTWVMRQNGRVMITGNTKAKRRVTLSFCGLGILDETEIESIPGARPAAPTAQPPAESPAVIDAQVVPPAAPPVDENRAKALRGMFAAIKEAGIVESERKVWMSEQLGHSVETSKSLSDTEVTALTNLAREYSHPMPTDDEPGARG